MRKIERDAITPPPFAGEGGPCISRGRERGATVQNGAPVGTPGLLRPESGLPSPDPLRGPPSPAEAGGRARAVRTRAANSQKRTVESDAVSGKDAPPHDEHHTRHPRRFEAPSPSLRTFARDQRRTMPSAEALFWQQVRGGRFHDLKFRRQVPIPPYIADFLCASARLIVELDGAPHETEARRRRDTARDAWLTGQGFQVLRFPNDLVLGNLGLVLDAVLAAVAARTGRVPSCTVAPLSRPPLTRGPPSPAGGGGGIP